MQRSPSIPILRIYICTFGDKQFNDFLATMPSRLMQRSHSVLILLIHIRTSIQFLLDTRKVTFLGSSVNRTSKGGCGQQHGCDCCD